MESEAVLPRFEPGLFLTNPTIVSKLVKLCVHQGLYVSNEDHDDNISIKLVGLL